MQYLEHILKAHPAIPNYIHFQLLRSVFCSQVLGPGVKLEELQLDVLELSVVRKPQREVIIYTPKQAGDGPEFRGFRAAPWEILQRTGYIWENPWKSSK